MKKKLLISAVLACLIGGTSIVGAGVSSAINEFVTTTAAQHEKNYDYFVYKGSYYDGLDIERLEDGMNGSLRKALTTLIEPAGSYAYSGGLAKQLQGADEDPDNDSNMVYFYTRDSVKKNSASTWNREHCWPQSLSNGCWGTSKGGCDMLHIRPVYDSTNSSRSNLKYGDINKTNPVKYDGMAYGYRGSYFEPLDSVKGDAARIIMYTWVAWKAEYGDKLPAITNVFESYDVLMKWHLLDKPDELEGNRNDYAQKSDQKNRNPFVDHPEYAWKIFGEKCSSAVLKEAKETYPESGYIPPVDVDVTGVDISDSSASLLVGEKKQLTATVYPSNATIKDVKWTSGNDNVASVSSTGLITAKEEGNCTITVTTVDGGFKKTCAVEVIDGAIRVTNVQIDNPPETLYTGSTYQFTCTVDPSDATNKTVIWSSSNTNVGTIDENGLFTPLSIGSTTIKVKTEDKGFVSTCNVNVEKGIIKVKEITLSTTDIEMDIGESRFIKAQILPENADNKTVTWANTDPSVCSCEKGMLKGLKEGTCTVSVTTEDGGFMADCVVSVVDKHKPVESVTISNKTLSLVVENEFKLSATVKPDDAANKKVKWESSNVNVATVDSTGLVKGISEGTATITVTTVDGGFKDTCEVTITGKGQKGDPTKKGGCSSSIGISSIIISISAITCMVGLILKKKKEQ